MSSNTPNDSPAPPAAPGQAAGAPRPPYFHPAASHVTPDYRDGWNAALKAAGVPMSSEWK